MSLEFVPYRTLYQRQQEANKVAPGWTEEAFYTWSLLEAARELNRNWTVQQAALTGMLEAEDTWIKHGRPYFKVWPAMALELMTVGLDLPASYLMPPFPVFSILLPNKEIPVGEGYMTSILVRYEDAGQGKKRYVHTVETTRPVGIGRAVVGFTYENGDNLEEVIKRNTVIHEQDRFLENGMTPEMLERVIRLTVAVCFFGTNQHEVIRPDIPKKYVEKMERARQRGDTARVSQIEKRYSKGYTVGRELTLPAAVVLVPNGTASTGTRRGLEYSHTRRPHLRLQQKGPRTSPYHELIFVRSTIVKPELPFDPHAKRGFLIPDKKDGT